ncbi:MAG: type II toxin-antitoxin system PemK/MazF family toxin [Candidatus Omnitrophica bacterium]|nr:type II toxin-antitoxin system PemK/MazF family toxin [Candidatus Omnitrophota bacterium]
MKRGEIWWAELPKPAGKRPVLLLSRDTAIQVREVVTVAQVTTVIRHIPVEVHLSKSDGMPKECVVNLDVLTTIPKALLTEKICELRPEKIKNIEKAILFALGIA